MQRLLLLALLVAGLVFAAWLPANNKVEQANFDLMQKIEARLGKPMTSDQRQQFARTATTLRDASLMPQQQFLQDIARNFKLPLPDVQAVAQASGAGSRDMISRLEVRLGRSVTSEELQQVRMADNATNAKISEIQSQFVLQFVQITGLSREQMQQLLPTAGM